jgi:pyruvate dehydrogenase E2 component (dihydrolipoamide acetyltransferase)
MAYEFKLPDIGEGVVEGEIVRWLVKEGEVIKADQPMVEVMTDKATVEIPSPRAGRVLEQVYAEGQICPVGKVLVRIEESPGAGVAATETAKPTKPTTTTTTTTSGPPAVPRGLEDLRRPLTPPAAPAQRATAGGASRADNEMAAAPGAAFGSTAGGGAAGAPVLATPATRKLARELGVNLAGLQGTGPAGRITSGDVRGQAHGSSNGGMAPASSAAGAFGRAAGLPAPAGDVRIPFRGLRRKIAEHMTRSRREAAHFTYVEEVDCTQLVDLREKANARITGEGPKLSYLPFIVRATVEALRRYPQMNAYLDEAAGEIVQRRQYHIGLATATPEGLIVPVVRDADRRSIVELAREIDRLARLTRTGKASREDLSGSTFTITSLGALGGVLATPILNYPEVGILGVHRITKRPAVVGDKVVIRDLMNLSISVDHRLVDGYDAARVVLHIKESLESPGLLFLESI